MLSHSGLSQLVYYATAAIVKHCLNTGPLEPTISYVRTIVDKFPDWFLTHWNQGAMANCANIWNAFYYLFLLNFSDVCCWRYNWLVIIGSGNGLLPDGNKPLPEPIMTNWLMLLMVIITGFNEFVGLTLFHLHTSIIIFSPEIIRSCLSSSTYKPSFISQNKWHYSMNT